MSILKPYYSTPDGRARLYLGDARQLPVEDESIDMIATSPPYWGKRDYGEDVVAIWGGEDGCEHEWGDEIIRRDRGAAVGASALIDHEPRSGVQTNQGRYCSLCGAWRGQLGLEPTWQEYIEHLCGCAKEWWRVLKPTGNLFVNMGDTFATHTSKRSAQFNGDIEDGRNLVYTRPRPKQNYPEKHKLGIPYRLRFALNDMGWVSRADIIWYKGKDYGDIEYIARSGELIRGDGDISKMAMPESARREACSYEMVFRFAKTHKMNYYVHERTGECRTRKPSPQVEDIDFEWVEHAACEGKGCNKAICHDGMMKSTFWHGYSEWFDLDAIRKPHLHSSLERDKYPYKTAMGARDKVPGETREGRGYVRAKTADERAFKPPGTLRQAPEPGEPHAFHPAGGNPGDVWIIQPEPFKAEHYAVWPSELCERMIKVGCPKEVCPKCGKPRERITKADPRPSLSAEQICEIAEKRGIVLDERSPGVASKGRSVARLYSKREPPAEHHTIGWSDCGCGEGFVNGVILDPFFGGSYRIAKEALKLGRNVIGVDMKEEYLEMAKDISIYGEKELSKEKARRKQGATQGVLL